MWPFRFAAHHRDGGSGARVCGSRASRVKRENRENSRKSSDMLLLCVCICMPEYTVNAHNVELQFVVKYSRHMNPVSPLYKGIFYTHTFFFLHMFFFWGGERIYIYI